jgi:hypothetical protein
MFVPQTGFELVIPTVKELRTVRGSSHIKILFCFTFFLAKYHHGTKSFKSKQPAHLVKKHLTFHTIRRFVTAVRLQVLTATRIKITVFWDVA